MTQQEAIKKQMAIFYSNKQECQTIKNILFGCGLVENEQLMPDERYSYIIIKNEHTYELSTGNDNRTTMPASLFIESSLNAQP